MMTQFSLSDELMGKINSFARRELDKDEVYAFPVILCDNEIDRDNERFSIEALRTLSELFVGKTGIFNHDPKGENQTARIFDTQIICDEERKTQAGEAYTALVGKAYMIRTAKNADLIAEIDGGIKKEVSISCSVESRICSICRSDKDKQSCTHIKGRRYGNRLCHVVLCNPTDAYEFSFVAIPAQRGAGVTKSIRGYDASREEAFSEQEQLRYELITRALKHCYLIEPLIPLCELKQLLELLDTKKLSSLCRNLSEAARKKRLCRNIGRMSGFDENKYFKL